MRLTLQAVTHFQHRTVPSGTRLVGWAAITHAFSLRCPVRTPSCVSGGHIKGSQRVQSEWRIFDSRYWPGHSLGDHLTFALRHEHLDLLVLKCLFREVSPASFVEIVRQASAGAVNRIVWFLYEWLTGNVLDLPDAPSITAVPVLDPEHYFTGKPRLSSRHRVRNNLLGTPQFCPIIRRTPALTEMLDRQLALKAGKIVGRARAQLVSRAASFMLLSDSQASFQIEGQRPARSRLERWGRAVMQAGQNSLTLDEIIRLQSVLIDDRRFVNIGLRSDGVFLGERDPQGDPLPEFIGARPEDLPSLVVGLLEAHLRMRSDQIDPVVHAAAIAFGFVFIHPLQDGNGRLHRCLIHHVLADRGFTPTGIVFPVSSVMLDEIDTYLETLRQHSLPLMDHIEWRTTPARNVQVTNDSADLYRYFDCTNAAEFLYRCVRRTVEEDLPREIDYLRRHDAAVRAIMEIVEMPDDSAARLIFLVRQNNGKLGKKRREGEWKKLTSLELTAIEEVVNSTFADFEGRQLVP
jgi:hypothetical protein